MDDATIDIGQVLYQLAQDNTHLAQQLKITSGIVCELAEVTLIQLELIGKLEHRIAALERRVNQ